ncbi:MAG: hypothetical protein EOO64_01050 [Massilia sp.]|nr:MAG: hypothetical protein EOO64_01050 [Massilia sp.]
MLKAGLVSDTHQINQAYVWLSFVVVLLLSVLLHHGVDMPSQKYFRRRLPARAPSLRPAEQQVPGSHH